MGRIEVNCSGQGGGARILRKADITYNGTQGLVITLPDGVTFGDIDSMVAICIDEAAFVIGVSKWSDTQIARYYSSAYSGFNLKTIAATENSFEIAQTSSRCSLNELLIHLKN